MSGLASGAYSMAQPGTTEVTETFDYTTAKSPRALEIFGQPARNATGITATLQSLAARFG